MNECSRDHAGKCKHKRKKPLQTVAAVASLALLGTFAGCGRHAATGEQPKRPAAESDGPAERADRTIRQLYAPEGRVKYLFSFNPGGPVFEYSSAMKELVDQGNAMQPRLLPKLKDAQIRNEVVLILARTGDKDALGPLIEFLPTKAKEKLTEEEKFSAMCLLYALWQLTGMELGIDHKFSPAYTPEFRKQWQAWYESNKDYLYTPSNPKLSSYNWGLDRVLVDVEAKLASAPTDVYRKKHPWIAYENIKTWRDDAAYQEKLKDFCFSLIVNLSWNAYGHHPREAVRSLGRIRDRRALSVLHALCAIADADSFATHDLIWTLEERGDPSSIPFLEKIPRSAKDQEPWRSNEFRRSAAVERIRLLQRYGKQLEGKPFDIEQKTWFIKCLADSKGVEELIAHIGKIDQDDFLPSSLKVASYVEGKAMRSFLNEMASDRSRSEQARTLAHGALARLGEKNSIDYLKRALADKRLGVQLAAAEGFWNMGRQDGFQTLVEIVGQRPLETGAEGVSTGNGVMLKVEALRGSKVEYIRKACKVLGEMGDRRAIEPLKRLLPLNLNGVRETGGSGSGWPGRPDAVALAKLGDFSGLAVLHASISKGDPLGVVDSWGGAGDFVEIGLKRFIPELLPMFENRHEGKRVNAAQAIILLLENGH
jgi:HEAT repeat protein